MAKLYKEAEESNLEGDEERAYIFYMRFFNLLQHVQKTPEFRTQKEQITALLGGNNGLKRTFDLLESISNSLRNRYEVLNAPVAPINIAVDPEDSHHSIETPTTPTKVPSTVSPKQLYEHIKDHGFSMLIMDCRPSTDFDASKLKYEHILNIPEEILVKGITVSKIGSLLNDDNRQKWSQRLFKGHIIIIDQHSCDFASDSSVWVLKDVLENWDVDFENRVPIQLLSGGFESFQTYYPTEVTNPQYKPAQNTIEFDAFGMCSPLFSYKIFINFCVF